MLMAFTRRIRSIGWWRIGWRSLPKLARRKTTARRTATEAMVMATTATIDKSDIPAGRVLILLDGSRLSLAALEAAAEIASARNAEVLGIFVEEVNLLRTAGYGFAWEVGGSSGLACLLDSVAIEVRMQTLAETAHHSL